MARKAPKKFSPVSLVLTLVIICGCSGALLAAVHRVTLEPIRKARAAETLAAIQSVLPPYANDPVAEKEKDKLAYYPARDAGGQWVGIAVPVSAKGYGGEIRMMVGLDAAGKVFKVQGLEMNETPGLGDAAFKQDFLQRFLGQSKDSIRWKVKKDGGDVDSITAATISSRAAVQAIAAAFEVYEEAMGAGTGPSAVSGATPWPAADAPATPPRGTE